MCGNLMESFCRWYSDLNFSQMCNFPLSLRIVDLYHLCVSGFAAFHWLVWILFGTWWYRFSEIGRWRLLLVLLWGRWVVSRHEAITCSGTEVSCRVEMFEKPQGLRKISWGLVALRFGYRLFQSLWNLTGTSAAALPSCLSNCRATWAF